MPELPIVPRPRCRPFTLVDGMILIAATAVALYFNRALDLPFPPAGWKLSFSIDDFPDRICLFVASGTLAWMVLRHRRPRPPRGRLVRQPGLIACLSATVVIFLVVLETSIIFMDIARYALSEDSTPEDSIHLFSNAISHFTEELILAAGLIVAISWIIVAWAGFLRRERGWLDLSGTLLGASWVFMLMARFVSAFFF